MLRVLSVHHAGSLEMALQRAVEQRTIQRFAEKIVHAGIQPVLAVLFEDVCSQGDDRYCSDLPAALQAPYLAGGFRDMTRLAGSSPQLWMGIFQDNREELLARAREFRDLLDRSISALELPGDPAGDLKGLMDEGWKMRTGWQAR